MERRFTLLPINQAAVQSIVGEKCRTIAYLRHMIMNLMITTTDRKVLPGIRFAGAAVQLFEKKIVEAINTAEIVVATRLLYTDKTSMFFS